MLSAFAFCSFAQQLNTPQPSSTQEVKQNFGLSKIELSYSRPGIKGRKIFGDLVPYGKVWRTGANSATTLTFGDDVMIGGTKIPAGKYNLLLTDASGRAVLVRSLNIGFNGQMEKISLPRTSGGGMYMVKLTAEDNKVVYNDKIVVQ